MSASLRTPNYNLPYYQDGDTLNFTDYNDSMVKIDSAIKANEVSLMQNTAQIEELQTTSGNTSDTVNKLLESVNTNVKNISDLTTQQNNLEHHVEDIETGLQGADAQIEQLQESLNSTVLPELTTAKSDITKLQQDSSSFTSSISALEEGMEDVRTMAEGNQEAITEAIDDVSGLQSSVNAITTKLNEHEGKIGINKSLIEQNAAAIQAANTRIDNVNDWTFHKNDIYQIKGKNISNYTSTTNNFNYEITSMDIGLPYISEHAAYYSIRFKPTTNITSQNAPEFLDIRAQAVFNMQHKVYFPMQMTFLENTSLEFIGFMFLPVRAFTFSIEIIARVSSDISIGLEAEPEQVVATLIPIY